MNQHESDVLIAFAVGLLLATVTILGFLQATGGV